MFKLVVLPLFFAAVSAGYLGAPAVGLGYGGYGGYGHGILAAPAPLAVAHAPALAVAHAPIVAAPAVVKTAVPVATSYANTYKVSVGAAPVAVHAAPAIVKSYAAAPVAYAAPAYAAPAYAHAPAIAYGHGLAGGLYHG